MDQSGPIQKLSNTNVSNLKVNRSNCDRTQSSCYIKSVQPSVAFNIEILHLFCSAKQMSGFHMKCNTDLEWVKKSRTGTEGLPDTKFETERYPSGMMVT